MEEAFNDAGKKSAYGQQTKRQPLANHKDV
jgi:hypothetical protein